MLRNRLRLERLVEILWIDLLAAGVGRVGIDRLIQSTGFLSDLDGLVKKR